MDPEPGEEVYFHGHPTWRSIGGFYVLGLGLTVLLAAIAGAITAAAGGSVDIAVVVLVAVVGVLAVLAVGFLRRVRTTYTISSRRLTIERGILSRELHETRLERVQNVSTRQSVLERLLRVGTVDFDTAGEAGFDFAFRGVANPPQIVRTVDRAIHAQSEFGSTGSPPPRTDPAEQSPSERG